MKRVALLLLTSALLASILVVGCTKKVEPPKVTKIGISIPSADHGWTGGIVWWANKGVKDIEAAQPGKFEFRVVTADGPSSQVRNVEDLMVWGMQYLVILPHESAPLTPIVKEAHGKDVKVLV
ncbi:MAG: LacI family transcriptional regulator, partial [Clostridia bacterium]